MFDQCRKFTGKGYSTAVVLFVVAFSFSLSTLYGGNFSTYRGLRFGMNLTAASKEAGTRSAAVTTVHQHPALIQEMDWQPRPSALTDTAKVDPVKEALLCFYNGELFRIVVTYDRYKIEGMTADDMVSAISRTYGAAEKPKVEIAFHSNYGETAAVIARWEDSDYSYDLVRTGDQSSFAMVLYSKRVDTLAQAAIVSATRLEAIEAPQRELDQQKKRAAEEQLVLEKARSVNKPNFQP
jgi:hypothetical protein